ncbi:MAG: GNAT family N-acetyltransferase [Paenibacillaceae bacterium]|nr:GNAT family N-acetyltransferase [Paenibacillaceae bacterium]
MYLARPLNDEHLQSICRLPENATELLYVSPQFRYPLTPGQIRESVKNRFEPTVVVDPANNEVMGYANLYGLDREDASCWLGNVIVSGRQRGKGVASFLLAAMMDNARAKYAVKKLYLSCHTFNSRGLAFYHKNGFKPFGLKISELSGQKLITIQMEKELFT